MFRRLFLLALLVLGLTAAAFAQTITTAESFFASVSETYGGIKDYSANLNITSSSGSSAQRRSDVMTGRVIFKRPNLLRIDFSNPDQQTIVFNGDTLIIYLPAYNVILNQSVDGNSAGSGANLATPQGLALLRRYYTIAYETGPDPVPMDAGSAEQVVVLTLSRRSTSEMFRTIRLLISPTTKMIRRIDARSIAGDQIVFDFSNYALNQGLLDNRFVYDTPASANTFNNFLFNE